jgi:hypothetical protein
MFLDAASTKFTQPGNESRSYAAQIDTGAATINMTDVVAALGFRKNPRDKKWVPRRMREQVSKNVCLCERGRAFTISQPAATPHPKPLLLSPHHPTLQWILLIAGLLPKNHRDRLFAPSPSPFFTPPTLTSRERDSLNMSPIGFVSSRPSSRPGSPSETLSGYFSGLTTKGR